MIFTAIVSAPVYTADVEYWYGNRTSRFNLFNRWLILRIDVDGDNLILYKRKGEYTYTYNGSKKYYHYQYYLLGKNARVNSIKYYESYNSLSTSLSGDNLYPVNWNSAVKQEWENTIIFDQNWLTDDTLYTTLTQSRDYSSILPMSIPIDNLTTITETFDSSADNCALGVPERFMLNKPAGYTRGTPLLYEIALFQTPWSNFHVRNYNGNTLLSTEDFASQDQLNNYYYAPIKAGGPPGLLNAFLFDQKNGNIIIDGLRFNTSKYITAMDLANVSPSPEFCDTIISRTSGINFSGNDFRNPSGWYTDRTGITYLENFPSNVPYEGLGVSTTKFNSVNPQMPLDNVFIYGIPISENKEQIENYVQTGQLPSDAIVIDTDEDGTPSNWSGKDPSPSGEDGSQIRDVDDMELPTPTKGALTAGAGRYYLMTQEAMESFLHWFWYENHGLEDIFANFWTNMYGNLKETILSYQYFPCTTTALGSISQSQENIILGRLDSERTAYRLNALPSSILLGEINTKTAYKHFNTFMDWEGYTNFQLYLPFLGIAKLPTKSVQNSILKVYYSVDVTTGQLNYIIKSYDLENKSGFVVMETSTSIAETIPISLMDDMENKTKLVQTGVAVAGATIGLAATVATGGLAAGATIAVTGSAISSLASAPKTTETDMAYLDARRNLAETQVNANNINRGVSSAGNVINESMQFTSDTPSAVGQINGLMGKWSPLKCYLIVDYPTVALSSSSYGRHIGYLNMKSYKLGDLKGFTTCLKPEINFTSSAPLLKEIEEIYQLLQSGIIL